MAGRCSRCFPSAQSLCSLLPQTGGIPLGPASSGSLPFPSRHIRVSVGFHLGVSVNTESHVGVGVCACWLSQDHHVCILVGGDVLQFLFVICRGIRRRWLSKMNLGIKSMRAVNEKRLPTYFSTCSWTTYSFVLGQVNRDWGAGQRKAVQFSAI